MLCAGRRAVGTVAGAGTSGGRAVGCAPPVGGGSCVGSESRETGKRGGVNAARRSVCGGAARSAVRLAVEFSCGGKGVRGGEAVCVCTG